MTRKQWAKLTKKEKRIKVAELCGWKRWRPNKASRYCGWTHSKLVGVVVHTVPDYLNDLNAMHEAEISMDDLTYGKFGAILYEVICENVFTIRATAAQRAEAFVLTMEEEVEGFAHKEEVTR